MGLLIDRLLARRECRGRTLRAVVLCAVLVEQGGTWRDQVVFREALIDPVLVNRFQKKSGVSIVERYPFLFGRSTPAVRPEDEGIVAQPKVIAKS